MKESYSEGVADHTGPESCAGDREVAGETWTGVHAGRVLSPEKAQSLECRSRWAALKAKPSVARRRVASGLRGVVDPLHAWKLLTGSLGDPVSDLRRANSEGPRREPMRERR